MLGRGKSIDVDERVRVLLAEYQLGQEGTISHAFAEISDLETRLAAAEQALGDSALFSPEGIAGRLRKIEAVLAVELAKTP